MVSPATPLGVQLVATSIVLALGGTGNLRGTPPCTDANCTSGALYRTSRTGAALAAPALSSRPGLSPPWWCTYDWIVATIGAAPDATVGNLEIESDASRFKVDVSSNDPAAAEGLDLLLNESIGVVDVNVVGQMANSSDYEYVVCQALEANPYFNSSRSTREAPGLPAVLAVVMVPSVVQIHNDNTASPWGLTSLTAEDAFGQFFKRQLPNGEGLVATTLPMPGQTLPSHAKQQSGNKDNGRMAHDTSAPMAPGFAPPWVVTYNWLATTIGATPRVTVGPLEEPSNGGSNFHVSVFSNDPSVTGGLVLLLRGTVGELDITVVGPSENASEQDSVHRALEGNPYFHNTTVYQPLPWLPPVLAVVMLPSVIQIYSDNLASPWRLTTSVAADAFQQLFNEAFPSGEKIVVTTLPKEFIA